VTSLHFGGLLPKTFGIAFGTIFSHQNSINRILGGISMRPRPNVIEMEQFITLKFLTLEVTIKKDLNLLQLPDHCGLVPEQEECQENCANLSEVKPLLVPPKIAELLLQSHQSPEPLHEDLHQLWKEISGRLDSHRELQELFDDPAAHGHRSDHRV